MKRVKQDWKYPKCKTSILLDTRVRKHLDEEYKNTTIPVSRIINKLLLEKYELPGAV